MCEGGAGEVATPGTERTGGLRLAGRLSAAGSARKCSDSGGGLVEAWRGDPFTAVAGVWASAHAHALESRRAFRPA